jgi:hypothetical protein
MKKSKSKSLAVIPATAPAAVIKQWTKDLAAGLCEIDNGIISIQEQGQRAIEVIREYGRKLIAAKEDIGHTHWLDYLAKNLPQLNERRAQRYMKLASKTSHMSEMKDCTSIRKAYIAYGIIPSPERQPRKALPAPAPVTAAPAPAPSDLPPIDVEAIPDTAPIIAMPVFDGNGRIHVGDEAPAAFAPVATAAETKAALKAVLDKKNGQMTAPVLTPESVRAWLKTKAGKELAASMVPAAASSPAAESSKSIVIVKPMTFAAFNVALTILTKLIPADADHQKFGDLLSTCSAVELQLAQNKGRRAISAYTR